MDRAGDSSRQRDRRFLYCRMVAGTHCKIPQPPACAGRDGRRLGDAYLRIRPLAARLDLGLPRRTRTQRWRCVMAVAILNIYLVLLFLLVHFKIVPFNLFWKASPFIVMAIVLICLFIPMG